MIDPARPSPPPPPDDDAAGRFTRRDRPAREAAEALLAPAATRSGEGHGRRRRPETPDPVRTPFEVDRDRILHTRAFRRLAHKTQVVLGGSPSSTNDHVVTRLTHALQVTQVARAIAAGLGLHEPLAEAIALGHDVGHAPFGHTGEEALAALAPGWHHAAHGVRVLDVLEGRNLTWEVRDGIRGHSWSVQPPPATPEARCVRFADRIAYLSHDALDAVELGVLRERDFPVEVRQRLGPPGGGWIGRMVDAVLAESLDRGVVAMAPEAEAVMDDLRAFMFERVYRAPAGTSRQAVAATLVRELVEHHLAHPDALPPPAAATADTAPLGRVLDHVAGMTDRFAIATHRRLFGGTLSARLVAAP